MDFTQQLIRKYKRENREELIETIKVFVVGGLGALVFWAVVLMAIPD